MNMVSGIGEDTYMCSLSPKKLDFKKDSIVSKKKTNLKQENKYLETTE